MTKAVDQKKIETFQFKSASQCFTTFDLINYMQDLQFDEQQSLPPVTERSSKLNTPVSVNPDGSATRRGSRIRTQVQRPDQYQGNKQKLAPVNEQF